MHDGRTVAIEEHGSRSGPDSATFIEIAFVSVTGYVFWPNFNSLLTSTNSGCQNVGYFSGMRAR